MSSKSKLDMMFGAFDQDSAEDDVSSPDKKDKKKKKKNKSKSKRKPDEDVADLQIKVDQQSESKRQKIEEIKGDDQMMDEEDEKLRKEGEIIEEIINTGGAMASCYDENDYVVELNEYANCTHEYVAPREYVRPEFKRPVKKAKQYKFTLDKF